MASSFQNRDQRPTCDPSLCDYITKSEFWLLGGFLLANCIATMHAHNAWKENSKAVKKITTGFEAPQASFHTYTLSAFKPTNTLDKQQKESPARLSPGQKHSRWEYKGMVWIAPYLKSRWHKRAAITLYFVVLVAHLLKGYWVSAMFCRTIAKLFRIWLAHVRSGTWPAAIVELWTMVVWSLLIAGAMFVGIVMFVIQFGAIGDLCIIVC